MKNKKFFKKIILTFFYIVLISSLVCSNLNVCYAYGLEKTGTDSETQDEIILENNKFKLTFYKNNGTFVLLDKSNYVVWNSIADNTSDNVANGRERMNMVSVMDLTYHDEEKDLVGYINTATGATTVDSNGNTVANIKVQTKKNSMLVYYVFKEIQVVVPLELTIDENGLNCSILSKKIVENSNFKILSISLLPYFGAAKAEDKGYLLLPDGSGALAYFGDSKGTYAHYRAQIYGRDECLDILMDTEKVQTVRMPVFGLNNGNRGFFGIITKGDADAFITASVSGQTSTYSRISTEFTVRAQDSYTMGESSGSKIPQTVKVYEQKALSSSKEHMVDYEITDFSVKYYILGDTNCDYNGMAQIYRNYLTENSKFIKIKNQPTLHIELPGAIRVSNKLFGLDVYSTKILNEDKDIENIITILNKKGIDNIDIKYTEWTKQQIKNQVNNKAKVNSVLGSNKSFNNMIEKYSKNTDFYFDANFYEAENVQLGYKLSNIFSYNVSGKKAIKYGYELENYLRSPYIKPKSLVSPVYMNKLAVNFNKTFKFNDAKISVSKISALLSSDFKEEGYTRTNCKNNVIDAMELASQKSKVMISGGNAYALPFAESVIDAPESSSNYDFADVSIPFYQLVVSGFMSYSYQPINSNTDADSLFLKSVETGAALHLYFVSQNAEYLPETPDYTKYTSINPQDWYDRISGYYSKLEEIYEATEGTRIISHKILSEDVNETTFENNCKIITNYSEQSFNYEGIKVLANGYAVVPRGN